MRRFPANSVGRYASEELTERALLRLKSTRAGRRSPGLYRAVLLAVACTALGFGLGRSSFFTSGSSAPSVLAKAEQVSQKRAPTVHTPAASAAAPVEPGSRGRGRSSPRGRSAQGADVLLPTPEQEQSAAPDIAPHETSWRDLAERGEWALSLEALEKDGGFERVLRESSADELMVLADVARSAGRTGRAILVLREVVGRFGEDPNAPLAAMMLGNLLSQAGDSAGAAHAYALSRRLSPSGDFAEDALVREFQMARGAGDLERAERLSVQYEAQFAGGRHATQLKTDLAELRRVLAERAPEPPDVSPEGEHDDSEPASSGASE